MKKRILALAMSICMLLSLTSTALATGGISGNSSSKNKDGESKTVLCKNHQIHTTGESGCGYISPIEEQKCGHIHDRACGYSEEIPAMEGVAEVVCDKNCAMLTTQEGDTADAVTSSTAAATQRSADAATPSPAAATSTTDHTKDCAYIQAVEAISVVEGTPCTHKHKISDNVIDGGGSRG